MDKVDESLLNDVIFSTGLVIKYDEVLYEPTQPVPGNSAISRWVGTVDGHPNLTMTNYYSSEAIKTSMGNYINRVLRFVVEYNGLEFIGTATALRGFGLFKGNEGLKLLKGEYCEDLNIRMAIPDKLHPNRVTNHRIWTRRRSDFIAVFQEMAKRGDLKEISVRKGTEHLLFAGLDPINWT